MAQDIRVMIPRVRRAVEGAGAAAGLTDEAVKDLIADSIASVTLYAPGWGHTLSVTDTDVDTGAPSEYEVDPELTLPEQTVIAAQAALDYFFFKFVALKVQERIGDEAQSWEYTLSANLLRDQLKLLIDTRDRALDAMGDDATFVAYCSFLTVRDVETARVVEPFLDAQGVGGLEIDYRFAA